MTQLRSIMPSLKESKRYLVFEIISKQKLSDFNIVSNTLKEGIIRLIGELGIARAELRILKDCWYPESQRGIMQLNNKSLNEVKASLGLIKDINGKKVIVRSIGVSGMLNKAKSRYLNNK